MTNDQQTTQRQQDYQRRIELATQIKQGEDSLFASEDDRTRRALDQKLTAARNELQQLNTRLAPGAGESFRDFHERHGGEYVLCDGKWLYPDGAIADPNGMYVGEPPADQPSKLQATHRYTASKLQAEIEAFKAFKAECASMAHWAKVNPEVCCPPPHDAAARLQRGKERIDLLQEQLQTITKQLGDTPEEVAKRGRQEVERERQQRLQAQIQSIEVVSIDGF